MNAIDYAKTLKAMIGQTPLIISPERDGARFQQALAGLSEVKLGHLYRSFNSEERRRFHYVANMCLGYESWRQLYRTLVVTSTQERLADRMEEAYAVKSQELSRREAALEEERLLLGEQLMDLEAENLALRREKERLAAELARIGNEKGLLLDQQRHTQEVMDRYRRLIAELKALLRRSSPPAAQNSRPDSARALVV